MKDFQVPMARIPDASRKETLLAEAGLNNQLI